MMKQNKHILISYLFLICLLGSCGQANEPDLSSKSGDIGEGDSILYKSVTTKCFYNANNQLDSINVHLLSSYPYDPYEEFGSISEFFVLDSSHVFFSDGKNHNYLISTDSFQACSSVTVDFNTYRNRFQYFLPIASYSKNGRLYSINYEVKENAGSYIREISLDFEDQLLRIENDFTSSFSYKETDVFYLSHRKYLILKNRMELSLLTYTDDSEYEKVELPLDISAEDENMPGFFEQNTDSTILFLLADYTIPEKWNYKYSEYWGFLCVYNLNTQNYKVLIKDECVYELHHIKEDLYLVRLDPYMRDEILEYEYHLYEIKSDTAIDKGPYQKLLNLSQAFKIETKDGYVYQAYVRDQLSGKIMIGDIATVYRTQP